MRDVTATVCDECQVHKKESNLWLQGWLREDNGRLTVTITGHNLTAQDPDKKTWCGPACAMKYIGKSIEEFREKL